MYTVVPGHAGLKIVTCRQFPNQIFTLQWSVLSETFDIIKKVKHEQYSDLPSRVAHLVNKIDHAIDE
jgi:hypothetical protein